MDLTWQIFAWIASKIDTPLGTVVTDAMGKIQAEVKGPLASASICYIILVGFLILSGRHSEAGPTLVGRVVKLAIVTWLATSSAAYNTYVYTFFFNTLPDALTGAISSGTDTGAGAIDKVWLQAWATVLTVWQVPEMGFSPAAGLAFVQAIVVNFFVVIFIFVCLGFCLFAMAVWLMSRIFLALSIIFGPIVIAMALFPATKSVFEKWIGALIGQIFLQGAVIVLLSMLIGVQSEVLEAIDPATAGSIAESGGNIWTAVQQLIAACIFYALGAFCGLQLTAWSAGLTGGFAFQTAAVAQGMFGWLVPEKKQDDDKGDKDKKDKSGGSMSETSAVSGGGSISPQAGESIGDTPSPQAGQSIGDAPAPAKD